MSNIAIQGAATGTGVFTLASPATNTNRTLTLPDEAGTVLTTAGVPASAMPAGSVLQVVQTVKTDTFSTTSASYVDITGLSVSITPTSSSNKILVMFNGMIGNSDSTSSSTIVQLVRGSTPICIGDASGSRTQASSAMWTSSGTEQRRIVGQMNNTFLDSPSTTSSTTYKLQIKSGGATAYVNRGGYDDDENRVPLTASTITVMEIAG
jgi:hypothetical protein